MITIPAWVNECVVPANNVRDFLLRYGKPDRYMGRGEDYFEYCVASHEEDVEKYGYTLLSRHDNVTGDVVCYVPLSLTRCFDTLEEAEKILQPDYKLLYWDYVCDDGSDPYYIVYYMKS